MHHVDPTPSAPPITASAPDQVTVALATHAGGLRAHHQRPGRPGGLGHPAAPTLTAEPSARPRAADPPDPASPEARVDAHHRAASADHRANRSTTTPDTGPRALSGPTTTAGPVSAQAPATAGTTTSSEAFSTFGATTTQPPVTGPTTTAAPPTTAPPTTAPTTTTMPTTTTTLATTTTTEPTSTEPTTTTVAAKLSP
jgi:hypothetical protein